ncbi:recombination mediator RecR [Brucepastera parasyntrophica]|uniref:recombination mediator RecR n=1 Tax=Brucepastera parasyntrophica TaxID=2880008 RepID=UPI00210EA9DD|nr:recombination mediator RecR [Brucepastera parasyntrophica]ULQ58985.1 recombination mediator RecR [Brucepastera parasyntrophica]
MNALDDIIESFSRIPGIGKKSAARIAHFLLKSDRSLCERLAHDLSVLHDRIRHCSCCGAYTEDELCPICSDPSRDRHLICVVEQPQDVQTIEAVREYNGVFHVLGGVIAPLEGFGPDQLRLAELIARIQEGEVQEVILATNPTVEGDTTALYIQKILKPMTVTVTRLASGLPVGGDLEYADRLTLARSFRGRSAL